MRRYLSLTTLLLLSTWQTGVATTVNVQADDTSGFSYFQGNDLDFGVSVIIGTFQLADGTGLSDAAIMSHAQDFAYLMANFTRFSTTEAHIGQGSANKGELSVELNGTTSTTPSLAGKQIYYFVIAGTDNTTVASSISTVQQIGVYYLDKASRSAWAFPSDSDIINTTTVDIADLTTSNLGVTLKSQAHVLVGSFGPDTSDVHPTAKNFGLAAIPEPASALLVATGLTSLLARRRRSP